MDYYKGAIPIIGDGVAGDALYHPGQVSYGLVPRDYRAYPETMFDQPSQISIIPESEWDARYDEQEAQQSSLEHLYLSGPGGAPVFVNLDQNGHGYCWAYSTGQALMLLRLAMNQPLVRLNPHATAAIIKGGRDEGGWCGLSGQWAEEHGYAVEGTGPGQWPLHSRSLKYDTPELRAAMKLHRMTEGWVDLTRQVHDRNLTKAQFTSLLFANVPQAHDFNHWGHSVASLRWVRIEKGSWGNLILNSWKDWGRHGLAVLRGPKAIPDGAIAPRVTTPSPV